MYTPTTLYRIEGYTEEDIKSRNRQYMRDNCIFDIGRMTGYTGEITKLVKHGANINATERKTGTNAMHQAAKRQDAVTFRILLEEGGNPFQVDHKGYTACDYGGKHPTIYMKAELRKARELQRNFPDQYDHEKDRTARQRSYADIMGRNGARKACVQYHYYQEGEARQHRTVAALEEITRTMRDMKFGAIQYRYDKTHGDMQSFEQDMLALPSTQPAAAISEIPPGMGEAELSDWLAKGIGRL